MERREKRPLIENETLECKWHMQHRKIKSYNKGKIATSNTNMSNYQLQGKKVM